MQGFSLEADPGPATLIAAVEPLTGQSNWDQAEILECPTQGAASLKTSPLQSYMDTFSDGQQAGNRGAALSDRQITESITSNHPPPNARATCEIQGSSMSMSPFLTQICSAVTLNQEERKRMQIPLKIKKVTFGTARYFVRDLIYKAQCSTKKTWHC